MATTHAETGAGAAEADATSALSADTTNVESTTDSATDDTTAAGNADVVEPEPPKPVDKPAEEPKKETDKGKSKAKKADKVKESTKKVADVAKKLVDTSLDEAGQKVASEDTKKLKFLRSHPGYAYWPGDTAALTAEHVTLLVDGGFAELADEPDAESEHED
jgi:outer membrane biosynthesis protein TonB